LQATHSLVGTTEATASAALETAVSFYCCTCLCKWCF